MIKLLKERDAFILWFSRAFSRFGDALESLALMFLVYDLTGSGLAMGTVMLFSTIPNVVVSPFAGVFIDRYNKRIIMFTAEMVRAIGILLIPISMHFNFINLWIIYFIATIVSVAESFFEPAFGYAFIKAVPKEKIPELNSLSTTTNKVTRMLGYSLAGFLIVNVSKEILFIIDSFTFLISAIAALLYRIDFKSTVEENKKNRFLDDFKDGIRYIVNHRFIQVLFFSILVVNAVSAPLSQFVPMILKEILNLGASWAGIFMTTGTITSIIGSIVIVKIMKSSFKLSSLYLLSLLTLAASLSLVLFYPGYISGFILFGLSGFLGSLISVWSFTKIFQEVDEKFVGRLSSFTNVVLLASIPLSSSISGYLIDLFSISSVYLGMVVIIVISAFLLFNLTRRFEGKAKTMTNKQVVENAD